MKPTHRAAFCLLILAGVTFAGTLLASQEEPSARDRLLELSRPGPVHSALGRLSGDWEVVLRHPGQKGPEQLGSGQAATILGGRFLVLDFKVGEESASAYRYTLGFDRRHDEYSIVVMDTSGTYHVTARGPETNGVARMWGTDDDPHMESLGFTKKFVYELEIEDDDAFTVSVFFVDTRTAEEALIPNAEFSFLRTG